MNEVEKSAIETKPDSGKTETNLTLLNQMFEWLRESEGADSETKWRTISEEDYDFYAGNQDDQDVLDELVKMKRPTHVFNTILPKVNMLIGLAAQSNRAPFAFPVGSEDKALADLINPVLKHYRRKLRVKEKEDECSEHSIKSGRSLLYFYVDNKNPFKPEVKALRIPGRDFRLDPASLEYDLSDSRYVFIDRWFTEKELTTNWPDIDISALKSMSLTTHRPTFFDVVRDRYRVVECWYRDVEMVVWFVNPFTKKPEWLREGEYRQFVKLLRKGIPMANGQTLQYNQPIEAFKRPKSIVKYCIFTGTAVIESGQSPHKYDGIPAILFGAYKNEKENRWFSVITMMKDPATAKNQMRRQLLHLLQTSPKGLLVHEVDAIVNEDEYDKKSAEPNFRLILNKGKMDKYAFTNQPQISPLYQALDLMFEQDTKDVSGLQDPLMGIQTSSREPGITLRMRQESGLAVLYILFNNFRMSRMLSGKVLLAFLQQYITTAEVIRIEGQEGQELMSINTQLNPESEGFNDITVGEYDFVVDEAMDSPTIRMATAQLLSDFAQSNPQSIPPDLILEFSDLPITVIRRVQMYHQAMLEREERMQEAALSTERTKEAMKGVIKLESDERNAKRGNKKSKTEASHGSKN